MRFAKFLVKWAVTLALCVLVVFAVAVTRERLREADAREQRLATGTALPTD